MTCVAMGATAEKPGEGMNWSIKDGWLVADGVARALARPAVNVQIADHGDLFPKGEPALPQVSRTTDGGFKVRYATDRGTLVDLYEPFAELGANGWRRSLKYTNTSDETQDLTRADMWIAPEAAEGGVSWRPWTFRMTEVADGRLLCVAHWAAIERINFDGDAEAVRSRIQVAWRLRPGETADLGHQGLWVGTAGPEECRREARRWYEAHGFTEPLRYPDWLLEGILYEASAGGHVESRFSDVGGFDAFARQIPYLADLGISVMWLNAVQSHKTPPDPVKGGWNHYDPRDFLRVDPILGGAEGFARLAETMRANGIHLLSEIVPHGGHSVQAEKLEPWWTRDRDGKPRRNWGGFGMDLASPEWQAVLRDSMAMLAKHGAIEGARIDVAGGQGSNWGSPRTSRASFSQLGAGCEMLNAIRDGIRSGPCQFPVLIPESACHPVYFATNGAAVLGYGFETTHFIQNLSDAALRDSAELNQRLRDHFDEERGSLPPGALMVRALNNHDTVVEKGRVLYRFGGGLHRALHGVMLSLPGIPMMYQEEEVGSFFALRRLNRARRALPMLATAEAHYPTANYFGSGVFSVLRTEGDEQVLCLVNLSGHAVAGEQRLPDRVSCEQSVELTDAVSGRTVRTGADGTFVWSLEPYETALLRVGGIGLPAGPAADARPETSLSRRPFRVEVTDDGFRCSHGAMRTTFEIGRETWTSSEETGGVTVCRSPLGTLRLERAADALRVRCQLTAEAASTPATLRIEGAEEWAVSGQTALLRDRVLRRHFPFPEEADYRWQRTHAWGQVPWRAFYNGVCPSGRLWQSLLEPLHPEEPSVAFAAADGVGVALTGINSDAGNIVLTDCSDEDPAGPQRLELRFLANDPDLHPNIQRFGPGQPWRLRGQSAPIPRPLTLSFTLVPVRGDAQDVLAASRLPFDRGGVTEVREGEGFAEHSGRIFLIAPGRVTWSGLAPVDGRYRIELVLRLSERSGEDMDLAEAYRVSLDGAELALTWGERNVWSTGNAYFARAQTPPVDLGGKKHALAVQTLRPWCAVMPEFVLIPADK